MAEGQIFGEERFIEILERREHDKRNSKKSALSNANDNYRNTITAPFTIKCLSSVGELYKIHSYDFENLIKKDINTKKAFIMNYKTK